MRIKVLTIIFLAMFLTGCATAKKVKVQDMQIQQLQSRMKYLETELEKKNQEINNLENELARTQDIISKKTRQTTQDTTQLSVRQIQIALKNAGFYKGPIDGKMGPQTTEAIKAFQKTKDLKVDGIVGKRTALELNKYLDHY